MKPWQDASKESAEEQRRACRRADARVADLCKAFNEIMTGPNPLTKEEIRALIARRPHVYGVLAKWAE